MTNAAKEQTIDLQLQLLPGFADYLLKERLHDFVKSVYRFSQNLNIPLLKFFSGMTEEEIVKLSLEGNIVLLTAIRDNKLGKYIEQSRINWIENQLPVITKTDVIAEDIGLVNFARKRAFRELLPDYTKDHEQSLGIIDELDRFILTFESVLVKTYLSIQQEKLRESHAKLKKREEELLEAQGLGKIGSFEWDLSGAGKSSYTPEVFKIFEFEKTSKLDAFLDDVHPDDRAKLRGTIERAMNDGIFECEYRYNRNNKSKVLYSRGRVFFDNGRPTRMVGTVTDITEKANLIKQLTESEELSKQAQALSNTGNWKWTINTGAIEWSDEMYRIYGLEPQSEKITFEMFLSFIHEEDRSRRMAELTEAIQTGIASDYILRINSRDGRKKVLKGKGQVIKDKLGKSLGILGTCQDITHEYQLTTELKKKNEELLRKNKDLESFNFIASHDLQEPLRKIQTFSNRILHEGTSEIPAHLMNYFSRISQASNRMQKMLEDFLEFYHSMNAVDARESVHLETAIRDACKPLKTLIDQRGVNIQLDRLAPVSGQKIRLIQLFRHLISNSIKFSKPETPVRIDIASKPFTSKDGKNYITIAVTDNGIGFDKKYSERIFEPFQKLHSQDEFPGSGVGLSLCKKIVEDHGGWISVASQPNVGTTFNIFLPKD